MSSEELQFVGKTGFEPAASCSQSRRSYRAELLPYLESFIGLSMTHAGPAVFVCRGHLPTPAAIYRLLNSLSTENVIPDTDSWTMPTT